MADFEEPGGWDDEEPKAVLGAEEGAPAEVDLFAEEVDGDTVEDLLPF